MAVGPLGSNPRIRISKEPKKKRFLNISYGLNKSIDFNICAKLIDQQIKEDVIKFAEVPLQKKVNVILQKGTTN